MAGNTRNPLLAAAVVAVAFQPVRQRAGQLANRVVYGRRASPYQVLSQFAQRIGVAYSDRNADYRDSEQRIGIVKEAWYLARTPAGDQLVAYMESRDFPQALSMFSHSRDEFDLWFKQRLADATGLDLNTPPTAPLPELLSSSSA